MPTMIGMTASHLDRFAVDQLKSCASDIVVATSGENTGPTTGGVDEGSHDACQPVPDACAKPGPRSKGG